MGIKEGTEYNEHWVLYAADESLNSTSETNNTVYVNQIELKKKQNKITAKGYQTEIVRKQIGRL